MTGIIYGVAFAVFLGIAQGAYPCDYAMQAVEALPQCVWAGNGSESYSYLVNFKLLFDSLPVEFQEQALGVNIPVDNDGVLACGVGIDEVRSCASDLFSSCNASIQQEVDIAVDSQRNVLCEDVGGTWKYTELAKSYLAKASEMYAALTLGSTGVQPSGDSACVLSAIAGGSLDLNGSACFDNLLDETTLEHLNTSTFDEAREEMIIIWEGVMKCYYQQIQLTGCSNDAAKGFMTYMALLGTPPGLDYTIAKLDDMMSEAPNPKASERVTVLVFGDPHIIRFDGTSYIFDTCSGLGYQRYFENNFIKIYGYNSLAVDGDTSENPATFMTAVSIQLFSDVDGVKTEVATYNYTLEDSSLPVTFTNGNDAVNGGFSGGNEQGASVHSDSQRGIVQIKFKAGGNSIAIKKAGMSLILSMRNAKSMMASSFGILVKGCPGNEIDAEAVSRRRKRDTSVCDGVPADYQTGCIYDVGQVGDAVAADYEDIEEVEQVTEEDDSAIIVEDSATTESSANGLIPHVALMLAMAMCLIIIVA